MCDQSRNSTVRFDTYLDDMVALCKGKQKNSKEHHKVYDLITHMSEHRHQKVERLEHSDKIDNLDQTHHYAEAEEDPHRITYLVAGDVKEC